MRLERLDAATIRNQKYRSPADAGGVVLLDSIYSTRSCARRPAAMEQTRNYRSRAAPADGMYAAVKIRRGRRHVRLAASKRLHDFLGAGNARLLLWESLGC
jgi:hypothetical protein